LQTDQLLGMLRCLAEDHIAEKHGLEIEQLYRFMADHEYDEDDDDSGSSHSD